MGKESEESSTQKEVLPDYVKNASQNLISKSTQLAEKPYTPYTADRVADFSGDQSNAFQLIRNLFSNGGSAGVQAAQKYGQAAAPTISTERIVDEDGKLGAINDYVNPNAEAALVPALRKIQEQADAARKRIGGGATAAGAFGDARHGILEGNLDTATSQAIGDTSATFLSSAFDKAMGQRALDLNRFLGVDETNANYGEKALERLLTGGQAEDAGMLKNIQALLASGGLQQGQEQAGLDADFEEFMRSQGHDYNIIEMLSKALSGTPYERSATTTKTTPDNSIFGALGSLGSSFLGTEAGAGMAATALGML